MHKFNISPRRRPGATGILLIAILLLFASLFPHAPAAKIKLHSFQEPNLTNGEIAFTEENQEGNADVFSVKPDGTALTNLSNTPAAYNDLPVWSPDGSKIAFESSRDDPVNYFFQIYVMTAAGSGQTRLTNNPGDNFNPVWSPDGSKIAFMNFDNGNTEIFVMNSDGTGQQNLTNNAAYDFIAAWSPDSSRIAFESDRDGNIEIYEMNADGSNQVNLSNDFGTDRSPSWSPDGNRIVFTTSRDGNSEVYVMNADGGGQVRLTNNSAQDRNPIWSPTGAMIVFSQSDAGGTRLRTMNTDGSGQVDLTDPSHSPNNFVWSPDGARIAFDSNVNGEMDIYVVDADASNLQRLTTSATRSIGPVWQPVFVAPPTPTPTPAATFGNIEINPEAIFVNEPGVVTVRSRISFDPGQGAATLLLQRLDSSGAVLSNEGSLTDDGNIDNGDELAGDGIFSVKREFISQVVGAISLRVHFEQNLQTADSRTASLDVFEHLTAADMQSAMDIMGSARQLYFSLVPGLGPQASRDVVISQLESNSQVRRVGGPEVSGNNIWIIFKSDIQGQLYLNPEGTRGGGSSAANVAPMMPVQTGGGGGERIKNSKAIVLSPMLHEFGATDEGPTLEQMLRNSSCPTCDVTYLADTDVTVDVLRSIYAYGIVAISSHGVVAPGGQVTFMSGENSTSTPPTTIQIDMLKKRVGLGAVASGYFYTIFPSFVRHYAASKYPNSLVYIGSCFSNNNNTMANAFLNKGAKT